MPFVYMPWIACWIYLQCRGKRAWLMPWMVMCYLKQKLLEDTNQIKILWEAKIFSAGNKEIREDGEILWNIADFYQWAIVLKDIMWGYVMRIETERLGEMWIWECFYRRGRLSMREVWNCKEHLECRIILK